MNLRYIQFWGGNSQVPEEDELRGKGLEATLSGMLAGVAPTAHGEPLCLPT